MFLALGCPVDKTTVMHLVARENLPEPDSHSKIYYMGIERVRIVDILFPTTGARN